MGTILISELGYLAVIMEDDIRLPEDKDILDVKKFLFLPNGEKIFLVDKAEETELQKSVPRLWFLDRKVIEYYLMSEILSVQDKGKIAVILSLIKPPKLMLENLLSGF